MQFIDRYTGQERNLTIVKGCTFWSSKNGDLYCVDVNRSYCWPITAKEALECVLRRESLKTDAIVDSRPSQAVLNEDHGPFLNGKAIFKSHE